VAEPDKEAALKASLSAQGEGETPYVSLRRFFDGNTDEGSIGCNVIEHPGVERFREVLLGLLDRRDVEAAYVLVAEIDPGEGCWPFTDTVLVFGTVAVDELARILSVLQPDEVVEADERIIPASLLATHRGRAVYAWWD
jgi:hypothetical protein